MAHALSGPPAGDGSLQSGGGAAVIEMQAAPGPEWMPDELTFKGENGNAARRAVQGGEGRPSAGGSLAPLEAGGW